MAKVDHSTSYYQKMAELQEKLKRSEEERMKLEEKFTFMMKSCREEEEKRIRVLRERYEKFLEDDKRRRDRNERILQTLEKIESRAAALTAKSERLKLLRKHYEAYLIRMYPLWKKHSNLATQHTVPAQYPLSLPMDTEKHLPWLGSSGGLYMNNMPLHSVRGSMSPGSDQLWVPHDTPRNISIYDNTKPHKEIERTNGVVEACSPAVEGALDNYLQRAAELLRVPVEELDGHSEKRDEEKSVHTEQDTSRDLLNVSLSDDSILIEKKGDKTTKDTLVRNTERAVKKITGEENHISEVDYLAGGDNLLSEVRNIKTSAELQLQNDFFKPDVTVDNEINMPEKNSCDDPNQRRTGTLEVGKTILDNVYNKQPDQESLANEAPQVSELKTTCEERLTDLKDEQIVETTQQQNVTSDVNMYDPSYQSMEQPVSEIQPSNNLQCGVFAKDQESPENMENINFAMEQETTNEKLEHTDNLELNDELIQQHANISHQEHTENPGHVTQYPIVSNQGKQSTDEFEETYQENNPLKGCTEALYSGNGQDYEQQQTTGIDQYEQDHYAESSNVQQFEQYPDNTQLYEQYPDNIQHYEQYPDNPQQYEQYSDNPQQYEQYPNNTQQFEQGQYISNEEQLFDQQYPEENGSNEQYLENIEPFEESEQKDNVQGLDVDPNEQLYPNTENNYPYSSGDVNQPLSYPVDDNQECNVNTKEESLQGTGSTQPALHTNTEGNLDTISNVEAKDSVDSHQRFQEDRRETPENDLREGEQRETRKSTDDEMLENQEPLASDITLSETKDDVKIDHFGDQSAEENNTGQEIAALLNPSIPSAIEEDSEESSAGFWNPPHHSTIPSVDELNSKPAVVMEDTSESSIDSKMDPTTGKPPGGNSVQQFPSLLGVPTDPAGDSAFSDQDEVEDQLAALVEDPVSSTPATVESKHVMKTKETKKIEKNPSMKGGKTPAAEATKPKPAKNSKSNKSSEGSKPSTRTGMKKPPSLIKVLESDSESLNLNTGGASNVDSDEFDFSTE